MVEQTLERMLVPNVRLIVREHQEWCENLETQVTSATQRKPWDRRQGCESTDEQETLPLKRTVCHSRPDFCSSEPKGKQQSDVFPVLSLFLLCSYFEPSSP